MKQPRYTVHPLVARYLHDLDVLLEGIEPVERAEVVEGVREHIDTSLSHTQGADSDVRAVLAEVGPASAVAEEAWAGRTSPAPSPQVSWSSRAWLPNAVAFFEAATLLVVSVAVGGSAAVSSSSSTVTREDGQSTMEVTRISFDGSVSGALTALIVAIPFGLVILVLVGVSALWTARQKAILMALPLASAIAFAGLPMLGYALIGINGVYAGAWTALALTVGGGGFLVMALVGRAVERSTVSRQRASVCSLRPSSANASFDRTCGPTGLPWTSAA